MSISAPFIARPIATSLLAVAVLILGVLGYRGLPVSSLPQVDFPTIAVTTSLPGASPETMTELVTAPLERQLGQIPALAAMTSTSSFGLSQITMQFNLDRDIDGAAQDVQAAISAAGSTLPRTLPYPCLLPAVATGVLMWACYHTGFYRTRRSNLSLTPSADCISRMGSPINS